MKKTVSILLLSLLFTNSVFAEEGGATTTTPEIATTTIATTTPDLVKLNIKKDSNVIFEGDIEIDNSNINITDNENNEHSIAGNNVLSVLYKADLESDSFQISDLQYYSSFDSFLINCLEVDSESLCYNWQYVVNDEYPFIGMVDYLLEDGDEIYFYFGQPRRLVLPTEIMSGIEFSIEASKYDYKDNQWIVLSDYTVGIFVDNPDDPWNPNIITTSSINELGKANFIIEESGTYKAGLSEDYYYPYYEFNLELDNSTSTLATSTEEVSTSTDQTATTTKETSSSGTSSGGSNDGSSNNKNKFDVEAAISFLQNLQKNNGSFGPDLYTDWSAVAFSASDVSNQSLKNYIKNSNVSSDIYEKLRKSMALLSLGLDPQEDFKINLIEEIISEFDGQQFGDPDLFNDDIFALIVLQKVGYDLEDEEITKTIDFVIENQSNSGGWVGVDITSAAIQALVEFDNYSGVDFALSKAENYLKNKQNADGGWGDVYSTSWAVMAMTALGYDSDKWQGDAVEYLADNQDDDGGLLKNDSESNRIWSTAYALSAVSEKTWIDILNNFSKKNNLNDSNLSSSNSLSSENGEGEEDGDGNASNDQDKNIGENNQNNEEVLTYATDTHTESVLRTTTNSEEVTAYINQQDNTPTSSSTSTPQQSGDFDDYVELDQKLNYDRIDQTASIINSIKLNYWWYLILSLIVAGVSVIMFKRR